MGSEMCIRDSPKPAPITIAFFIFQNKKKHALESKTCFFSSKSKKSYFESEVAAAHITTPNAILFIKSARL